MITEREIIERGAGVEVGVDLSMIDTVVGIEIVIGTEAAVEALITIKVVVEVDMMMRGVAEVIPMEGSVFSCLETCQLQPYISACRIYV